MRHRRRVLHRGGAAMGTITWPSHPWQSLPWSQLTYLVTTKYWRSYRVFKMGVEYAGQPWSETPWQGVAWTTSTLIGTRHSRTSS